MMKEIVYKKRRFTEKRGSRNKYQEIEKKQEEH